MSETNIDKLKLKIDVLELNLKQLKQELELLESSNELDKELNEISRVKKGDYFYSIFIGGDAIKWVHNIEINDEWCDDRYNAGNYFQSEKKVQDFASKLAFLFKLQKLHDTFCPDYEPDWSTNSLKYYIIYDTVDNKYRTDFINAFRSDSEVYFPNLEIAHKVCDILNKELDSNE